MKIFIPFIPLLILHVLLILSVTTKDEQFVTVLFTILLFSLTFFIQNFQKKFIQKNYFSILYFFFLIIIFIIILHINYFSNLNLNFNISENKLRWFLIISSIIIIATLVFSKISFLNKIKNISSNKYSQIKNFNIDMIKDHKSKKSIWEDLDKIFTDNHKKESSNLLKKNKLRNSFSFKAENASFLNISKLKNSSNILHTFHEAVTDIIKKNKNKEERNNDTFLYKNTQNMLGNLIYQVKFIHYKMALTLIYNFMKSIFNYFIKLLIMIIIMGVIFTIILMFNSDFKIFTKLILYQDLIAFISGLFLFITSIPLGYTYFIALKFNALEVHLFSKHDSWIVFYKNLTYYLSTFFLTLLLLVFSLSLLSASGVEYNYAFHFIGTLLLPTLELQNLPSLLSRILSDDIVFAIISIKIFFLLFIFLVSILLIQHLMELYIELYEESKTSQYSIPPEFASFFSYLVLSIFALVLVYGTLFINYPSLEKEYNHCQSYMSKNQKTIKNCKEGIIDDTNKTQKYCQDIKDLNSTNPRLLDFQQCYIGMQIESSLDARNGNSRLTSDPSLSDYMPLSIFLTLFGVVMMISTKNLLENYFTGLSLKINTPFEEGERIRIDGGEMLSVENIGFRATTFYGISSHANLVIPHQKLTNSIITNYTQPTLDYRETITIYIPDRKLKNRKSIPREAEKILLLAAFLSTGVKKPRLGKIDNLEKDYSYNIVENFNTRLEVNAQLVKVEDMNNINTEKIWEALDQKERKKLFFNELYKLVNKENNNNETSKKVIKKIVSSIIKVINDYQNKINTALPYSIDKYNIKRKAQLLSKYNKDKHEDLEEICDYLVNINYYYFSLAKQLWLLKSEDKSDQQKNIFDHASLELLDVPRVTSAHKRDMEGAFWEVSLMVTVELAEQSDEIVQHINMFLDELWDIFELPSRCRNNEDTSTEE